MTDQQLLRDYTNRRSEAAFAELVRRHVDFVYSAALRMVRDAQHAEDVTQSVFVALAQNARQLTGHAVLSGWLHRTTQNLAANAVRSDVRRRAREQEAAAMNELLSAEPETVWEQITPYLDEALGELGEDDRDALLLRYFERKSAREMAQTLGTSEDAAQKRVNRAVERLREFFAKRGITVGASGLVVVITANGVQSAPIGLAAAISGAALSSAAGGVTALTILKTMTITKMQFSVTALLITGAAISLIVQHQNQVALREQNESLHQQMSRLQTENEKLSERIARTRRLPVPRLPAPTLQATASTATPMGNLQSTNLLARVVEKPLQLTAEQAESFLAENHRSASSLLAAFRTTGNTAYLDEAMQRFPDNPQVAFEAALRKDASPEEKRRWLDALKKSAPDNPVANYLSALAYFNSSQADLAVQELIAASGKSRFNDYFLDRLQGNEEAYRSAGYSEIETRVGAAMGPGPMPPQVASFKELTVRMVDLAKSYRQAGDETSAQATLQMALNLGGYMDGSRGAAGVPPLIRALAFAIERHALEAMDPASSFGSDGTTVKDRLDYIAGEKAANEELIKQLDILYPKATPQDMINFLDRARLFGDEPAMEWLKQKYGEK